jgi:threonine dehydrogenase-like Zn-dependent dehydrogenase
VGRKVNSNHSEFTERPSNEIDRVTNAVAGNDVDRFDSKGRLVKAAVYYGDHDIRLEDIQQPSQCGPGELLIAVSKVALCGSDSAEWSHGPKLATPPVILGHEFVGVVVAFGPGVTEFAKGDRVVSGAGVSCNECEYCRMGRTNLCRKYFTLGLQVNGGLEELVLCPSSICHQVPAALDDISAVFAQPLAVAIHGLRRAKIARDTSTVINGVGGIGAFMVAGAVALGADPVIAIDVDEQKLRKSLSLGATHAVNALTENVASRVHEILGGQGAQAVVEATGSSGSPQICLDLVRSGGDILILGLQSSLSEINLLDFTLREIDFHGSLAHVCGEDIPDALQFLLSSQMAPIVLGEVIGFDDVVELGFKRLAAGNVSGKIVVDLLR